jgi:hypothetical protein
MDEFDRISGRPSLTYTFRRRLSPYIKNLHYVNLLTDEQYKCLCKPRAEAGPKGTEQGAWGLSDAVARTRDEQES